MAACEICGNRYERLMTIRVGDRDHHFDCFECAIDALAPRCGNCGVRVIGHGVETEQKIYCSAHCGRQRGERDLCDHPHVEQSDAKWSM